VVTREVRRRQTRRPRSHSPLRPPHPAPISTLPPLPHTPLVRRRGLPPHHPPRLPLSNPLTNTRHHHTQQMGHWRRPTHNTPQHIPHPVGTLLRPPKQIHALSHLPPTLPRRHSLFIKRQQRTTHMARHQHRQPGIRPRMHAPRYGTRNHKRPLHIPTLTQCHHPYTSSMETHTLSTFQIHPLSMHPPPLHPSQRRKHLPTLL
jgi:hypothetical protein